MILQEYGTTVVAIIDCPCSAHAEEAAKNTLLRPAGHRVTNTNYPLRYPIY